MIAWNEILLHLQQKMSMAPYKTWIENSSLQAYDEQDNTLTIEVPNDFVKLWIEKTYSSLIAETIYDVTDKHYKLQFITNPNLTTNHDQHEADSVL